VEDFLDRAVNGDRRRRKRVLPALYSTNKASFLKQVEKKQSCSSCLPSAAIIERGRKKRGL